MSLNLGTKACEALKLLRGDPRWTEVRNGVADALRKSMDLALTSNDVSALAYTRAIRDMHVAFEAASDGVPQAVVPKQTPGGKG